MDKLKTILVTVAVILGALAVLSAIGLIYTLLSYLAILGILGLGGYIAFKLLRGSKRDQLPENRSQQQLTKVERVLEEYKRRI